VFEGEAAGGRPLEGVPDESRRMESRPSESMPLDVPLEGRVTDSEANDDCFREVLVRFSCKGRGFCPSCCGRRMAELAAHLVDGVLGGLAVRQWVLTLPHRLR
jgi:hypothetical protein